MTKWAALGEHSPPLSVEIARRGRVILKVTSSFYTDSAREQNNKKCCPYMQNTHTQENDNTITAISIQ